MYIKIHHTVLSYRKDKNGTPRNGLDTKDPSMKNE
jgi:hypothetical protein